MDSGESHEKPEKSSYLGAAVGAIAPSWGSSRSSTPKPPARPGEGSGLKNQHGGFQSVHHWGLSSKRYPSDCPPLNARWFFAVDVGPILRNSLPISKYRVGNRLEHKVSSLLDLAF